MISMRELLGRHTIADVPHQAELQLEILQKKLNVVREKWGKPMIVTSGFRLPSDQSRINAKAPKSAHLLGMAADIADPNGELYEWTVQNEALMVELGLYVEVRQGGWVHYQTRPTKRRFFLP